MTDLTSVGLFAGIGGIELGLEEAGFATISLCELDRDAQEVLKARFPTAAVRGDVRTLNTTPRSSVLTAGFPCQDLSQAGRKTGITGSQSGLVDNVFRLLGERARHDWLLIENVSYMLRLDSGAAMNYLVTELEDRGYRWAYRVVDARAFGVPQRRQRVFLLASKKHDPRAALFADEAGDSHIDDSIGTVNANRWYGFYWTEGLRGLGWTRSAVPTIKGGSTVGIPSAPAIWQPRRGLFGTPSIEDAERLQGLPAGWTNSGSEHRAQRGARWRMVGNAVCVPMAHWVGKRLVAPGSVLNAETAPLDGTHRWPTAAWGDRSGRHRVSLSMFPEANPFGIEKFLHDPLTPLSVRAASGFLSRAERSNLRFAGGFLDSVRRYIDTMKSAK